MEKAFAIIIPSYNESNNLVTLLPRIFAVAPKATVIVVDDSSKEQHEALQLAVTNKMQQVQILFRGKKLGRGSAVLAGFAQALKDPHIEYFFEMDADLSHDPAECTKLLAKTHNADLVIGSRYTLGGHIYKWPLRRLILSKIINKGLNMWLGLHLTDYTNGFRVYRRSAVTFLMREHLKESGFMALSEMAYKLKRAGFRITEVPTSFTDRINGASSASLSEHFHAFFGAMRIRLV